MDESKSRRTSKTVWLGVAVMAVSILGLLAGEQWIQEYPAVVSALGLAVGILGIVIRHYTSRPLKGR